VSLRVGIVGCGFIGRKRAAELGDDELVGCYDVASEAAAALAAQFGGRACASLGELLELGCDVIVVAVVHDQLAPVGVHALRAGSHVLVEKPAGLGVADVDGLIAAAEDAGRLVKVGFNHRFYPAIARTAEIVHSGRFGPLMFVRGRYGHGGRVGYESEWRMDPARSGGGELVDQGMHLIDLLHWLAGPLPLHSALLRTSFWEAQVEDNAALLFGAAQDRAAPWASLHATWTEWKNLFSLEVYCRTGKIAVDGLAKSYGPQKLRVYAMKPEMGPPELEEVDFPPQDVSWRDEWANLRAAVAGGERALGDLESARYAWTVVERAYELSGWNAP